MINNVVILEVAWGRGARWFKINPRNFTGSRLYSAFGDIPFVVTNACPEVVCSPDRRGTPSAVWLRANLARLTPSFVLVCGAVAKSTFDHSMVSPDCKVLECLHPAARTWTKVQLAEWRTTIRSMIGSNHADL